LAPGGAEAGTSPESGRSVRRLALRIEEIFGLTKLGQAKTTSATFGTDIFTPAGEPELGAIGSAE
jgi:hypothetical protein